MLYTNRFLKHAGKEDERIHQFRLLVQPWRFKNPKSLWISGLFRFIFFLFHILHFFTFSGICYIIKHLIFSAKIYYYFGKKKKRKRKLDEVSEISYFAIVIRLTNQCLVGWWKQSKGIGFVCRSGFVFNNIQLRKRSLRYFCTSYFKMTLELFTILNEARWCKSIIRQLEKLIKCSFHLLIIMNNLRSKLNNIRSLFLYLVSW